MSGFSKNSVHEIASVLHFLALLLFAQGPGSLPGGAPARDPFPVAAGDVVDLALTESRSLARVLALSSDSPKIEH